MREAGDKCRKQAVSLIEGVLSVIAILRQKAGCSPAEAKMSPDGPLFL
jgi:hypothetical protein